ncbi:MAG: hypothetical protein ACRDHF_08885, partial [Tepidiformaceae bacterium]
MFATREEKLRHSSRPWTAAAAGLILCVYLAPAWVHAATPPSGTVSEGNQQVSWTGPFVPATGSASCNGANDPACDNFRLTIVPPSPSFGPYLVEIMLPPELVGDWDLQVYG